MSYEQPSGLTPRLPSEDNKRPSDDSGKGILSRGQVARPIDARMAASTPEPYSARLEFEGPPEDSLPARHPSRQIMRWGPQPSEYGGWDDRDDRRHYGRPSYDYGHNARGVPVSNDYYPEEMPYTRPYRRTTSVREPPRGPPKPPSKGPPRKPEWHDESDSDSTTASARRRRRRRQEKEDSPEPPEIMRLPFTWWMNSSLKNHFVAALGEFVGTTMFLFFAFAGTQVANIGAGDSGQNSTTGQATGFSPIVLLYIAVCFGFSLMVNVWIFFRISGGLFNPAVTLAMVMTNSMNYVRGFLLVGSQVTGSIFSSYLVSVLFPTTFNVRTTLSAQTGLVRGVFIEAILTAELVFAIFMLAKEKHRGTFMAPIGIGLALFVAELVGVYYTGGSLNPARSFGPCVVTGKFDPEHWIYWVGPAAGAVVAVVFYKFIKVLEYEMANPGQDLTTEEDAAAAAADATTPKKEGV